MPTRTERAAPRSLAQAIQCSTLTCLMGEAGFECKPATFDLKGYQLILCDQTKLQSSWAQEQAQVRRKICNVGQLPGARRDRWRGHARSFRRSGKHRYMIVIGQGPWQIRRSSSA